MAYGCQGALPSRGGIEARQLLAQGGGQPAETSGERLWIRRGSVSLGCFRRSFPGLSSHGYHPCVPRAPRVDGKACLSRSARPSPDLASDLEQLPVVREIRDAPAVQMASTRRPLRFSLSISLFLYFSISPPFSFFVFKIYFYLSSKSFKIFFISCLFPLSFLSVCLSSLYLIYFIFLSLFFDSDSSCSPFLTPSVPCWVDVYFTTSSLLSARGCPAPDSHSASSSWFVPAHRSGKCLRGSYVEPPGPGGDVEHASPKGKRCDPGGDMQVPSSASVLAGVVCRPMPPPPPPCLDGVRCFASSKCLNLYRFGGLCCSFHSCFCFLHFFFFALIFFSFF